MHWGYINMVITSEDELVSYFDKLMTFLPALFDDDVSFGITDNKKYLKIINSVNLPINAKPGDLLPNGGAAFEALRTGKIIIKDVSKEVYGVPFKSYAIPIKDDNNMVIGIILVGKSLETRHKVSTLSENLATSFKQISASIQKVSSGVQNILDSNTKILGEVDQATENTKGTDDILKFVQNVSNQTNLLGLNAAIEAARAGEMGKGFSVVAQEIRKLSNTSSESIRRIDSVLRKIEESVNNISNKVNESSSFFEAQVAEFEEINASIEALSSTYRLLEELSKKL